MNNLEELKALFSSQKLAVLASSENDLSYVNLVAFAADDDLRQIVFATSRSTLKYRNIRANPSVALLADNRSNQVSDFEHAIAVTAIGKAHECEGDERERLIRIYTSKHSNLASFVDDSDTALMRIDVERYIVAGFAKTKVLQIN